MVNWILVKLKKVEHEKDCVSWHGEYSDQIKINGSLACQIKHEFSTCNNSNFLCKINVNDLIHIQTYFSNLIDECGDLSIPKLDIKMDNILKISDNLNFKATSDKLKCKVCSKILDREKMRTHTGAHIIDNKVVPPHNSETCGFCGLSSCRIDLVTTSG
jgi:hypothetical protein